MTQLFQGEGMEPHWADRDILLSTYILPFTWLVFTKSLLLTMSWKTTCLDSMPNSVVDLHRFSVFMVIVCISILDLWYQYDSPDWLEQKVHLNSVVEINFINIINLNKHH